MDIKKLGIIAGSGNAPLYLIAACREMNIEPFVIGFKGQTDEAVMQNVQHCWSNLGAAGFIIKTLKENDIADLVMIGGIKRPEKFRHVRPDFKAVRMMLKIGYAALGDDTLLTALKKELNRQGIKIHGVQNFCKEMLAHAGAYGKIGPTTEQQTDIKLGYRAAQELGRQDQGQAVVVQNGKILGLENARGTNVLIKHCANLKSPGTGPILVKTCKPQQDRDLDLPTIGPDTVKLAHESGFSGIAVQTGETLLIDLKTIEELADQFNMFVVGVSYKEQDFV